jgi:hypothetical protein
LPRLAGGHALQQLAHGEQEDNDGRLFRGSDEQRAGPRYRHQAFNREGTPFAQRGEGGPRHRRQSDQAGPDERPFACARGEVLDGP